MFFFFSFVCVHHLNSKHRSKPWWMSKCVCDRIINFVTYMILDILQSTIYDMHESWYSLRNIIKRFHVALYFVSPFLMPDKSVNRTRDILSEKSIKGLSLRCTNHCRSVGANRFARFDVPTMAYSYAHTKIHTLHIRHKFSYTYTCTRKSMCIVKWMRCNRIRWEFVIEI